MTNCLNKELVKADFFHTLLRLGLIQSLAGYTWWRRQIRK